MLITWMTYATLIGIALSAAAFAVEHIVAIWGGARRVVWVVALAAAVSIPLVIVVTTRESPVPTNVSDGVQRITIDGSLLGGSSAGASNSTHAGIARTSLLLDRIDKSAPTLWLLASTLLFALFLRASVTLRGRRAEWRTARVDGCDVLVAREVGPAVVGAWRPRIVFPEWALALGADERTLMLHHERQHVTARDPLLLLVAAFAIVVVPWNAALWLIVRRLRLAVEIDCDARVLRTMNRPREYGMLLLAVGARNGTALPYAASLAERKPFLERRIRAMTTMRPSHPVLASVVLGVVAIATTTLAAQAPRPEPILVNAARGAVRGEGARRSVGHMPVPTAAPVNAQPQVSNLAIAAPAQANPKSVDSVIPTAVRRDSVLASTSTLPSQASTDVAIPASTKLASRGGEIPLMTIFFWIEEHHPEVISGKAKVGLVTIIVDANDDYVSSTTDKSALGPIDSATALADPVRRLRVDAIANIDVLKGAAAIASYGDKAVNGVIVITTKGDHTRSSSNDPAVRSVSDVGYQRFINGDSVPITLRPRGTATSTAQPLYVIDGVIVEPPAPVQNPADQLEELGVPSDGIRAVDVLHVSAGSIFGTSALSIVIVKLKA